MMQTQSRNASREIAVANTIPFNIKPIEIKRLSLAPKLNNTLGIKINDQSVVPLKYAPNIENSVSASLSNSIENASSIFCIGQLPFILEYVINENSWVKREYDELMSDFKGDVSYSSTCQISYNDEYLLSGGISLPSNKVSSKWYSFRIDVKAQFKAEVEMLTGRFSHASTILSDNVYVIGGITLDITSYNSNEITLRSWERYNIHNTKWEQISPMIMQRSHFGIASFQDNYIYVFGGFNGVDALDTIEKYDAMLDIWNEITVKLPLKISNVGVVDFITNESVMIWGGMFLSSESEYSYLDTTYKMDLDGEKIFKMPRMNDKRIWHSSMPYLQHLQFIYKFNIF